MSHVHTLTLIYHGLLALNLFTSDHLWRLSNLAVLLILYMLYGVISEHFDWWVNNIWHHWCTRQTGLAPALIPVVTTPLHCSLPIWLCLHRQPKACCNLIVLVVTVTCCIPKYLWTLLKCNMLHLRSVHKYFGIQQVTVTTSTIRLQQAFGWRCRQSQIGSEQCSGVVTTGISAGANPVCLVHQWCQILLTHQSKCSLMTP